MIGALLCFTPQEGDVLQGYSDDDNDSDHKNGDEHALASSPLPLSLKFKPSNVSRPQVSLYKLNSLRLSPNTNKSQAYQSSEKTATKLSFVVTFCGYLDCDAHAHGVDSWNQPWVHILLPQALMCRLRLDEETGYCCDSLMQLFWTADLVLP
ncbi:hypothetical protein F2Q69_00020853 [Brassica cretica]|uniref:Uncharacterized protein n=1 Tax=Brassica cretica TaxID=69181 RepID=A0A8S9Q9Q5_BRACR|nr:hypothetical protein F2Q69_00020853 [Brassica cretica]